MSNVRDLIDSAISQLGSQAKLGVAAGVTQNAIFSARKAGRVSADLALAIDRATGGRVPKWRLRPDLWSKPSKSEAA